MYALIGLGVAHTKVEAKILKIQDSPIVFVVITRTTERVKDFLKLNPTIFRLEFLFENYLIEAKANYLDNGITIKFTTIPEYTTKKQDRKYIDSRALIFRDTLDASGENEGSGNRLYWAAHWGSFRIKNFLQCAN